MSLNLDPVVANKLKQFRRRRMRLLITRGVCAGIATFLVCMSVVALTDWYWLLSDNTRWLLSAGAYLATLITVWATSLRRLFHAPAIEEIATQMELTEPVLRENLLSAVELATDDPAAIHDSPTFRRLLQGKVAQQMGQVQVPMLLPIKLVAKWAVAALALVALVGFLLTTGDVRFRQLATRAILPGANIARVSRIHVEVLQPTPHSLMLAEDETVAVVVEVTGGTVGEVFLETFTSNNGSVKLSMRDQTNSEYVANIHISNETVEYRILAGDAVTQRYRIESRPRPHVIAFHKTYDFPKYSQLPLETVTEKHGDLLVLEGTSTRLVLETDQEVSAAELRIKQTGSEDSTVIPLMAVADESTNGVKTTKWQANVPVHDPAIYKVHLVSKETGFENLFSPRYEIRPQPDLIPRAGFVDQQEATLLLPPNDILGLKGLAEDDLPLVSLEQQISVNGREWETIAMGDAPKANDEGRQLTAAWQWDLLTHKLKTGDQVMTKLVATDRKGNIGESIPLRILVAAPEFDPQRHAVMERKIGLYQDLADYSALVEEHKTSALEVVGRLRQPDQTEEQIALDHATLLDLAAKQREQAGRLLQLVKQVEHDMPAGADAYDLDLTGRVLSRLQREHANVPGYLLASLKQPSDEKQTKRDLDDLKKAFERTADDAKSVAYQYRQMASHNFLASIAFDLEALLRQQKIVVESSTQSWDRLLRQETIVVNQLRVLERLVRDQRVNLPDELQGQMNDLLNWSESQRQRLQDSSESEDNLDDIRRVSVDFLGQLEGRQKMDVVDGGLPGRLTGARRDFLNRSGSLYVPIDQVARAIQQENRLAAQAIDSSDSEAGKELLSQAKRFAAEVDLKHRHSLEQLPARRELTQSRPDADSQYAADAGLTHRAISSLLYQHREIAPQESPIADNLLEVAPAYRTLEGGHHLIAVQNALNVLLNMERWNSQGVQARVDHPRQWDMVNNGLELASQRLQQAAVKKELVDQVNEIRWSEPVRDADRKIGERRWKRDVMVGAGHELVEIRDRLTVVVAELKPIMSEARAIIARYAPTIPQMAQQAADQLRKLEEETTAAADAVEETVLPENQPLLSELKQEQDAINQQIAELFAALVEDANSQDLLDVNERERARDADDSIAMIQQPAAEMNRALEQAQAQESTDMQAKDLAMAAEQQEKTAQALEMVAEHFDRLDQGLEVADSREQLRQAERELGVARQMNQQFENAEQISQMSDQPAEELLAELEAELERNPAMQQALSEISQNTLQEARNALEFAANDDQDLQQANESSDAEFKAKKKEVAENLREMGQQASQLSRALVEQAKQSASRGKTPEAQKKLEETQQKLNEVAQQANQARETQLLSDLAQTTQETSQVLREATENLKQAKQQTTAGKDEQIHADDKARENQKKDSERRRQQFYDQQKRTARDVAKRADDANRRAEQNVRNAEQNVKKAEQNVVRAQSQLKKKPDDRGEQDNLKRQEAQRDAEQQKLAQAQNEQKQAEQVAQQAKRKAEDIDRKQMPALNAANPATQLADQYTEEAIKDAEELTRQAEQLAKETNFGNELTPSQDQLANSQRQQKDITQNVTQVAEDVARAARHERRLDNPTAADPLQMAAEEIQSVANNESVNAEQQLSEAALEAEQAKSSGQNKVPGKNGEALQAQSALQATENALSQQAEQLTDVLEPLLAAADQESGQGSESASMPTSNEGQPAPSATQASPSSSPLVSTPEELARGKQLAQTLDELDRQQAAASQAQIEQGQPGEGQPATPLDSLAQAARSQQAAMATARSQAQQQAAMAMGIESSDVPSATGPPEDFELMVVNRNEEKDWGKLREKSAEDLTKGKSEDVSEEYRKSVETYFRVLAERARKKK